jgi:hypothetical protein
MQQKENPGCVGAQHGVDFGDFAAEQVSPKYEILPPDLQERFYLHIEDSGRERRWHQPVSGKKALLVEVIPTEAGPVEETRTVNRKEYFASSCTITPVKPRGKGWTLYEAESDNFTVWRRPLSKGVADGDN